MFRVNEGARARCDGLYGTAAGGEEMGDVGPCAEDGRRLGSPVGAYDELAIRCIVPGDWE